MEAICTAAMILLALCTPLQDPPRQTRADTPTFTRVSPSSSLLGRQVAVVPADAATPSQGFPASLPWGDPRRLAYCAEDGIRSSLDGGQSWRLIPTDGVEALAAETDWPLAPRLATSPGCQSVTLDPGAPDTFYVVFAAVHRPQDAPPPWFAAGYLTRDAGQSWQPVPRPENAPDARFGGFTVETGRVQALFSQPQATPRQSAGGPAPALPTTASPPLTLQTTDGGQTWAPVAFDCPSSGPCLRWGAPPTGTGSCAMHGYPQPLLVSADGGRSWKTPAGVSGANACRPNELVIVGEDRALLFTPGPDELDPGAAPVRVSEDGGLTFTEHPFPDGPDQPSPDAVFEMYVLPDERLLARVTSETPGPGWTWRLLGRSEEPPAPGQSTQDRWCMVASAANLPQTGSPLRVAGSRVWWLADDGQPESRSLTDLQCEGMALPSATPVPTPTTGAPATPVSAPTLRP